jgi:hypothetical protein
VTKSGRTTRTPAGEAERGRRSKLSIGIVLLLGLFAGLIGTAPQASAHHPEIAASHVCVQGLHTINYTATSWTSANNPDGRHPNIVIAYSLNGGDYQNVGSGAFTQANGGTFSGSFTLPGATTGSVVVRATDVGPWENQSGGGNPEFTSPIALGGPCTPPATPSAQAHLVCAEDAISIAFTGVGSATTVDIRKDGVLVGNDVPVPVGPSTYSVPLDADDENTTVDLDLDYAAASATDQLDIAVPVDCDHPSPTIGSPVCAARGFAVTLGNTEGEDDATFTIVVDGVESEVVVPPGGSQTVTIPVAEGDTISLSITSGDASYSNEALTRDCEELQGSVVFQCAAGGVAISVTNTGDLPTSIQVNGGAPIEIAVGATYATVIPVAEGAPYSVTVTGNGFSASASGTRDCEEPAVQSVALDCAEGGVVVVLTNGGELPAPATVAGNAVVIPAASGDTPGTLSVTVPVAENATYDFDIVIEGSTTEVAGTRDCEQPSASATFDCAVGGVVVRITNSGESDTVVTVSGDDVVPPEVQLFGEVAINVPAGTAAEDPVELVVPVAEDASWDITVTGDGLDEHFSGVRDCEQPAVASANLVCAEGGVVVLLTNSGESDTSVLVNGVAEEVPAGTTAEDPVEVFVPVDENDAYDITVVGSGLDETFSGTANCLLPEPTVEDEVTCAKGGLDVVLRNTGDDTATFVITSPALPDGGTEVDVAAGEVDTVLIPLAEGATTDVVVTSDGVTLFDASLTRDCETVGGEVVRPPAAPPLPRTGADLGGLLGWALSLLAAGAALVAIGRRRRGEVLS